MTWTEPACGLHILDGMERCCDACPDIMCSVCGGSPDVNLVYADEDEEG